MVSPVDVPGTGRAHSNLLVALSCSQPRAFFTVSAFRVPGSAQAVFLSGRSAAIDVAGLDFEERGFAKLG